MVNRTSKLQIVLSQLKDSIASMAEENKQLIELAKYYGYEPWRSIPLLDRGAKARKMYEQLEGGCLMSEGKDEIHARSCRCDLCEAVRKGEDITKEPSQQQAKDVVEMTKKEIPPDYMADSLVSKQNTRIQEMVNAHWSYMEKVLSTGQDKQQTFTWDQMMEIRKWDYTSAATHFYGHGYEDAIKEQEGNVK